MSINRHLEECAIESGVDLEVSISNEKNINFKGHVIQVWYDETSSSPFAWNAFIKGFGTYSEQDRNQVIYIAKQKIEAKEKIA